MIDGTVDESMLRRWCAEEETLLSINEKEAEDSASRKLCSSRCLLLLLWAAEAEVEEEKVTVVVVSVRFLL